MTLTLEAFEASSGTIKKLTLKDVLEHNEGSMAFFEHVLKEYSIENLICFHFFQFTSVHFYTLP